jgi:triacylglycerol lipase
VCSAQFGEVLGDDYLMNHLDVVNQMVGLVAPLETQPLTLYREHARRLLELAP